MSEAALADNTLQQLHFPHTNPQNKLIFMITTEQENTGLLGLLPPNNLSVSFLIFLPDHFNIQLKQFCSETTGQTLC